MNCWRCGHSAAVTTSSALTQLWPALCTSPVTTWAGNHMCCLWFCSQNRSRPSHDLVLSLLRPPHQLKHLEGLGCSSSRNVCRGPAVFATLPAGVLCNQVVSVLWVRGGTCDAWKSRSA